MTAPIAPERVAERLTQMADLMEMLWKDGLRPDEFLLQEWITILRNPVIFAALGPQNISVEHLVRVLEGSSSNTDTDPGWRAATELRLLLGAGILTLPAAPSADEVKGGHE